MKTIATITAFLASTSVALVGTPVVNAVHKPNPLFKVACSPVANSGPDWDAFQIDACDGELNARDCVQYCDCQDATNFECNAKEMSGCSNAEMAKACMGPYTYNQPNGHWFCLCDIV